MSDTYTLGVEEEYQLVNPDNWELCGRAGKVLATVQSGGDSDRVRPEMHRCQIEIATNVCSSLDELREELQRSRRMVIAAAQEHRVSVVAASTHPFSRWRDQAITDKDRYHQLAQRLRQTIRELRLTGPPPAMEYLGS